MKRWAILVSLFLTSVFLSNAVFAACSGTCHTDCGASSECDGKAKGSSWCDHGVFKTCDSNCQYSEVCTSSCGSETLCIGKKPREQWCNGNTYHGCTRGL